MNHARVVFVVVPTLVWGALACGGPPRRPNTSEASAEQTGSEGPRRGRTLFRFFRDDEPMLTVDEHRRVFRGTEYLARYDETGALYDEEDKLVARLSPEGPVRAGDGRELPFVIRPDGTLWVEGQPRPGRIDADGTLTYSATEDLRVRVVGVTDDTRAIAMLLVLHQSGYLSQEFRDAVLRAKVRTAQRALRRLLDRVNAYRAEHNEGVAGWTLPLTPPLGCDERRWPEDADPRWAELGFSEDPTRFSFSVEATEGDVVLRAVGDLHCDGNLTEEVLRATPDAEGRLRPVDPQHRNHVRKGPTGVSAAARL